MVKETYKLYAILLGCRPAGRNIEQHDVFFTIATSLKQTTHAIKQFWPEAKGNIHIDAWREVSWVNGFSIDIVSNLSNEAKSDADTFALFFINLGGYKQAEWEEFHYKMLIVASNKEQAIAIAKHTAFFKHTGFKKAPAHVDDTYGIDIDDIHEINEILSAEITSKFLIEIKPVADMNEDELHLGYLPLFKIS